MTPLQLGTQEYVNTQNNLLTIVASQPFYKTLVANSTVTQTYFQKYLFYKFILINYKVNFRNIMLRSRYIINSTETKCCWLNWRKRSKEICMHPLRKAKRDRPFRYVTKCNQ